MSDASARRPKEAIQPPANFPYKLGSPRVRSIADRGRHAEVGVTSPRLSGTASRTTPTLESQGVLGSLGSGSASAPEPAGRHAWLAGTYATFQAHTDSGSAAGKRLVTPGRESKVMKGVLGGDVPPEVARTAEWRPATKKKAASVPGEGVSPRPVGRKHVETRPPELKSTAEPRRHGKAHAEAMSAFKETTEEYKFLKDWQSLRRVEGRAAQSSLVPPFVAVPATSAGAGAGAGAGEGAPGSSPRQVPPHLAVSRPLWSPEVTVSPRKVVPPHLAASHIFTPAASPQPPAARAARLAQKTALW